MCDALMRTVKDLFEEYCYLTPQDAQGADRQRAGERRTRSHLAEYIAGSMHIARSEDKQTILSRVDPLKQAGDRWSRLLEE